MNLPDTYTATAGLNSRREKALLDSMNMVDSAVGDSAFTDILVSTYMTHFELNYCHLANPDEENRFSVHGYAGTDEIMPVYRKYEEHCVFKNESLQNLPFTIDLHLDLKRWEILSEINPLYNAISKKVKGFEIISALHPDTNGLIGVRFDGKPLPNERLHEHKILSPHFINMYHIHRKITAFNDISSYLHILGGMNRDAISCFCDDRFVIISAHEEFNHTLRKLGVTWQSIISVLDLAFKKTKRISGYTGDTVSFPLDKNSLILEAGEVIIKKRLYYSVILKTPQLLPRITPREREIWEMIRNGYSNRLISESLEISTETVKKHISNLFEKTGARNRTELSHMDL